MRTIRSVIVLVLILFPVLGCATHSVDSVHVAKPNEGEMNSAQSESSDGSHGISSTCSEPPESLVWGDKTYRLKEVGGQDLEPGMKLGYLECSNGVYTQRDVGENAVFNMYSFGSPLQSDDLLYFGTWGRALYTPADTSEERGKVKLEQSVHYMDDAIPVEKPEVRELKLSPELEEAMKEKKQPMQGLFETTLEAKQSDGNIDIRITLKNISGRDLNLHSGSGQRYDFHVLDENGEEVYRWSYDKSFTAALVRFELKKSEQLEFEEVWMLQDNKGEPVSPGKYTIVAQVMAKPDAGEIRPEELTARTVVNVQ
jgi:hypothetical protein